MTRDVVIYSRPGCHLCEVMKAQVERALQGTGTAVREVNVDESEELANRYGEQVPVLMIDGRKVAKYRITATDLTRALTNRSG